MNAQVSTLLLAALLGLAQCKKHDPSPEAQLQHGERLLYTVPVVIFGLLRYTYQVHSGRGEDVARDLVRDPWIAAAGLLWLLIFLSHRF